jgi:tRNA(Ile)-lysidine synthase
MIQPPTPRLIERFQRDLARLLHPPKLAKEDEVAIAVSGGPDSLGLLLLAAAAWPERIAAVTVDHGLRPEAADEARFVAEICATLSMSHTTLRVTVADDPAGIQATARRERYVAMAEWAAGRGITALATAHHLDDQAETVMMRLERGAGVAGLSGIRPERPLSSGVRLIRPLLGWRRSELADVVRAAGITAIDDPSNRDTRYDRAAMRARLSAGWPDPVRLAAVAGHMAQAEEALAITADRLFAERFDPDNARLAAYDVPRELRRRLLLKALNLLAENVILRGDEVDRLLDRLAENQVSTLAGLRIEPGSLWRFAPAPPHRSV